MSSRRQRQRTRRHAATTTPVTCAELTALSAKAWRWVRAAMESAGYAVRDCQCPTVSVAASVGVSDCPAALGVYNRRGHSVVLRDDMPPAIAGCIMAHELAHAADGVDRRADAYSHDCKSADYYDAPQEVMARDVADKVAARLCFELVYQRGY